MDGVVWQTSPSGSFSVKVAYQNLAPNGATVEWHKLVWYPQFIPKASFILWLAIKCRLGTQDRLYISSTNPKCLICNSQMETHDHLFFTCPVSSSIWGNVLHKCHDSYHSTPWEEYISLLSNHWKGKSLMTTIKRICLASTVYIIWAERNSRYHNNNSRDINSIVSNILELAQLKLSSLSKVKNNSPNQDIKEEWGLPDSIFH